jgi:surface carbohydrate biosynthesis protein
MKISSISAAVKYFYYAKKKFRKPKSSEIILFDREGSEDFFEYLTSREYQILDVRGESINMIVLFKCILKYGFNINMKFYCLEYIKFVKPKFILTFIDNTLTFYQLKYYYKNGKFISVQNGLRDNVGFNQFKRFKNLSADYIFTFGDAVGERFKECIDAKIISLGSFKNNKISIKQKKINSSKKVLFISQYRKCSYMELGNRKVPFEVFYSAENFFLPFLLDYCKKNNLELNICGGPNSEDEKKFFENILGDSCNWTYTSRKNPLDSYRKIDTADYVVFIDSTLGVEALGRNAISGCFTFRGRILNRKDSDFGYHDNIPSTGPFWTSKKDTKEFKRVMDFITSTETEKVKKIMLKTTQKLITYNQDNSKFTNILNK